MSCRFSQSALSATMAAVLGSAGTHSEVEWVCMLAKFLQQSLLQPTVGFLFLWHWREGLKKKEEEGKSSSVAVCPFLTSELCYRHPCEVRDLTWKVEM